MKKMSSVCDYFVIASGSSTTQVRAIADHIARKLGEKGEKLWHIEGQREALWILLDYGDVVAHVFLDETRRFYNLERLWNEAPQESFKEKVIIKKRRKAIFHKRPGKRKGLKRK